MSGSERDDADRNHEPTPQKLRKAREKGDVPRSADLAVAASYAGLLLSALAVGGVSVAKAGTLFMVLLDQSDALSRLIFADAAAAPVLGIMARVTVALAPWFAAPALLVLLSILAQRAAVVAPDKLRPKLSRISPVENARNKFGRRGLFEFAKSLAKLIIYSLCLGLYLRRRFPEIDAAARTDTAPIVLLLARCLIEMLMIAVLVAALIAAADLLWQHAEFRRRNMMTRKELQDETREAEGDPHIRQQRRQRGQEIAMSQIVAKVPGADVVVVNPTHFAVVLKWSRRPGSAPECVAKGVDEVAAAIRRVALEAGVPIHHDPPTARALYASVDVGAEIDEAHYRAVAVAIRFAERMRQRARTAVT